METEASENKDVPSEMQDLLEEQNGDDEQAELQQALEGLYDLEKTAESPVQMEIRMSDNEEDLATSRDVLEEGKEVILESILVSTSEMYIELDEMEVETSSVLGEKIDNLKEKLEILETSKQSELPAETEVESPKDENESVGQGKEREGVSSRDRSPDSSLRVTADDPCSKRSCTNNSESDMYVSIMGPGDHQLGQHSLTATWRSPAQTEGASGATNVFAPAQLDAYKSNVQLKDMDEVKDDKEEEQLDSHETVGVDLNEEENKTEETSVCIQELVEESTETTQEILQISEMPVTSVETQETLKETNLLPEQSKRIESPDEPNTQVPKDGDVSTTELEKQPVTEEQKELFRTEDESSDPIDFQQEPKELDKIENEPESSSEPPQRTRSSIAVEIELAKMESEDSRIPVEKSEDSQENQETFDASKPTGLSIETEIKLPKIDDTPIVGSEIQDEPENQEEEITLTQNMEELSEVSETALIGEQETVEESMETMLEVLNKVESLIDIDMETSSMDDASALPAESQEQSEDHGCTQKIPDAAVPAFEVELEPSESSDIPLIQPEGQDLPEEQTELEDALEVSFNTLEETDFLMKMSVEASSNEKDLAASSDLSEGSKEVTKTEDTLELPSELTETKFDATVISNENLQRAVEEVARVPEQSESLNEMEDELLKCEEEQLDNQETVDVDLDVDTLLEISPETKTEVTDIEEVSASIQEPVEQFMETTEESSEKTEPPVDVKIKLSKFDEIPVTSMEKEEVPDEIKSVLERSESPKEMEIELPKHEEEQLDNRETIDVDLDADTLLEILPGTKIDVADVEEASASIQEPVEEFMETIEENSEKTEPLIDIDIKLSKFNEIPVTSMEKEEVPDEIKSVPERAESPKEMEIELPKDEEEQLDDQETVGVDLDTDTLLEISSETKIQVVDDIEASTSIQEPVEESTEITDENSGKTDPPINVTTKLGDEVPATSVEKQDESIEIKSVPERVLESSNEIEDELLKCEEEQLDDQETVDVDLDVDTLLQISPETKVEVTDLEEASTSIQEPVEESIETNDENSEKTAPPVNMEIKLSEFDEIPATLVEQQEKSEETKSVPESFRRTDSLIESKVETAKSEEISVTRSEQQVVMEEYRDSVQFHSREKLAASCDTPKRTNSPLGMKIKLFKTGDASIVPLDFHEEPREAGRIKDKLESSSESPKRTESPIGMKIKLAKTKGGASIIPIEKLEDPKEKLDGIPDTPKRTDSPLGMRIKLSKTGDASIVQSEIQDENKHAKHKERVDSSQRAGKGSETSFGMKLRMIDSEEESMEELQEALPKVESPIGMKIRLSRTGDASIVSTEKQEHPEETKSIRDGIGRTESPFETKTKVSKSGDISEGQSAAEEYNRDNVHIESKEKLETYGSPKRTNSPIGMKIKLLKSGDASIVPSSSAEESKETCKMKDRLNVSCESPKRTESPIGMKIKLAKTKGGASIIPMESFEDPKENLEVPDVFKRTESPLGMKIKLFKSGDASIVHSEVSEEAKDSKQREKSENKGKVDVAHDSLSGMKTRVTKLEETSAVLRESPEESMETVPESWQKVESPIGMKIKLSKFGDASIIPTEKQEHLEETKSIQEVPKRTESPLGMKIRLSKTGDASIIQPERSDHPEEYSKDHTQPKPKDKLDASYDSPKRTGSPLGMKIKLSRTGDASIVSSDLLEENKAMSKLRDKLESSPEVPKRTESPIGMKIKLAKTKSGAAIIPMENPEDPKEKLEVPDTPKRTESPLGMKIKLFKSGDASIVHSEMAEEIKDTKQKEKSESREKIDVAQDGAKSSETLGMKTKVTKSGETPMVLQESGDDPVETTSESWQKVESLIGMKIKLSKFGDASIIPVEKEEQPEEVKLVQETPRRTESPLGMKIKLSKSGDASIVQPEVIEDGNKLTRTDTEHSKPADTSLGVKIKLLKTGDASIVDSEKKERQQRRQDTESPLEMKIKLSKTGHPTIIAYDNQGEATYKQKEASDSSQSFVQRYKESGQNVSHHKESALKILKTGHPTILQGNRSELTIEPIQMQGKKVDGMHDISPKRKDISISPIESKKPKLDAQFTQILPEVTIQPVASREQKQFVFDPKNSAISLQQMNVISQEISITQVRPSKPTDGSMSEKLKDILSNKNVSGSPMNSDCEIIEQRPELIIVNENSNSSQDVVIIEEVSPTRVPEVKIPKKRGRPRRNPLPQGLTHPPPQLMLSRDPLSLDEVHRMQQSQLPRFESRENERPKRTCRSQKSYAPPKRGRGRGRGKRKLDNAESQLSKKARIDQDLTTIEASTTAVITIDDSMPQSESFGKSPELYKALKQPTLDSKVGLSNKLEKKTMGPKSDGIKEIVPEKLQKVGTKSDNKDMLIPPGHPNWLTPISKRASENVSTVQVIDEETRMSAESGSRSQTPARNIPVHASETIINEESQGSVLSTATTESEKVKVKNRRMEINFDPDEGPFTVDKIAEYEWPLDRKGETFMIQEQISQYLGVKSFKRKYPDLKRRVVDMEERNYLRENGLVSEAMCDMGLTAVCSSEVLDVMCSDFPDQYEEYRKHMREKQVKEHSKKQKELTAAATAEKNRIDLAEMAVQSALSWNISLNKARREDRKCSLDLQTFTIHVPKKQQKVEERKVGYYPVALIPGQYTDYYREYTPAELRYYPLNTVLYGPTRPNERKFDSQSEGSQSDNDSDSSSDDSSSSSSEGTQNTEGSQSTMDDVDMEIAHQKEEIKLKCKMCLKTLNKHSKNEILIQCGTCNGHVHPSCIDLTLDMVPHIQSYAWQCTDCKTCAQCHDPADEDKMLFCDMCDRGYHIYCVGLRRVPQGRWHCQECAVCANCASREPGGINSDRNSVAQWQHEYKKGDKNTRVYVSTLCVPCSKLWRKGRYCPHCSRCHTAPRLDLEANLVHCSACDKYLHLDCVETKGLLLDRKNYLCDFCAPTRQHMIKPLMSKSLRM